METSAFCIPGPTTTFRPRLPEAWNSGEHRGVEPALYGPEDRDWAAHIRAKSTGDAIHAVVGRDDIERISALRLNNESDLPTRRKLVASKGQVVDPACDEPVTGVELRRPPFAAKVITVLRHDALRALRIPVKRL